MELQFRETALRCLRQSAADTKSAEQTLELRLPENMPPIGRVLGAWGQPLLRSKDWRGDHAALSGGVMVRALYESEDGTGVHCVEGWIPFSLRWELKDSRRDGQLMVSCLLRSVDARQVGAEKLLLRASVSAMAQALEEESYPVWQAETVPEEVQLLREERQLCVAAEAGERALRLEEELVLPPGQMDMSQLMFCQLSPAFVEKKLVGDKLLLRGTAALHAVYMGVDGMLHAYETELPISQFGELEREYGPDAELWVEPAVTDLELERLDDGRLRLKADILGQYVVYDRPVITMVRDAYAPGRTVELQRQQVMVPHVAERGTQQISIYQTVGQQADRIVDATVYAAQPRLRESGIELEGAADLLYYDEESRAQGASASFSQEVPLPESGGRKMVWLSPVTQVQATPGPEEITLQANAELRLWTMDDEGISMITGLTVGEAQPDAQRPSLILRKAGNLSLWELAKKCGSTVDAIRSANGLEGEPESGRMLIIPVL